jgi:hypothetical protein
MKRQRGRGGRKPAGHHPNRNFESSGPDLKIRGSAAHIYEKYLQLARDASSSGDRVMAENYLQHAEHYFRMLRAMQPQHVSPQFEQRFDQTYDLEPEEGEEGEDGEAEGVEDEGVDAGPGGYDEARQQRPPRHFDQNRQGQHRGERRDDRREDRRPQNRPEGGYPQQAAQPQPQPQPQAQAGGPPGAEGEFAAGDGQDADGYRGRRRRRGRFRPMNGEGGERAPREGGEQPNVEGFGDSAPAFLGGE